jgi:diguanylate cyclase (GGDEF)-like protein
METLPQRTGPISLVLVDLDHFKHINTKFGHAGGDQVLIRIGRTILDEAFDTDVCIRMGGEEFAIFLFDCNEAGAQKFAQRLHTRIRDRHVHLTDGRLVKVTASVGCGQYQHGESARAFYDRVDQALYAAKDAGRDCIRSAA